MLILLANSNESNWANERKNWVKIDIVEKIV